MKIAVVAPTQIPARRANTIQVMKMAQAMVNLGHNVHLAVPVENISSKQVRDGRPADTPNLMHSWDTLSHHYGLRTEFPITWFPARSTLRRYDFSLQAILWARRWGSDLIYTRLPQVAALASTLKIPVVFEIHDFPHGSFGSRLFRRFLKGVGARRLVVITQSLAQDLTQEFNSPLTPPFTIIAPDGVDLDRYADLPGPTGARELLSQSKLRDSTLSPECFTAGYTGHLYRGRGVSMLLKMATRTPDITYLLVGGEAAEIKCLKSEVQSMGINNIILVGFVPNAELPLYQAACDVLMMPYQHKVTASSGGDISRYLSPMKLFEYMACGRAILSSNLQVLKEVLNPQNAVLLPPDDVDAWTGEIQNLRSNHNRLEQLATQARKDAAQYTWKARAERILDGL